MEFKFSLATFSNSSDGNGTATLLPETIYLPVEMAFLFLIAGSVSLGTIIGNILVMLSIIINRSLQTINNYYLFSLAVADLIVGMGSMNLYTLYIVIGYWPLGPAMCDFWLILDYVVCSASVLNLLIISFDRYFCITKPLSYPMWRTTKIAGVLIVAAWVISFILWAPLILFWQFIVGERTVPDTECYIQFISNATITFSTHIAAFNLPVAIMLVLYWKISKASKSRVKTSKCEPSGLKQENRSESKVGNHFPTPEDDDKEETQDTDSSRDGGAPHAAGGVEGKVAENSNSHQGDRGPVHSGGSGTAKAVQQKAHPPAPADHKVTKEPPKRKVASSREKRVTRIVMAMLVAVVVSWTPYNVMVLLSTFCSSCIPNVLWTIGYWFCYINSTVNPVCYALCNATFKKTFKHLLLCQYKETRLAR